MLAASASDPPRCAKPLATHRVTLPEPGIEILEGLQIRTVENTMDNLDFVLPPALRTDQPQELPDEQLEADCGGIGEDLVSDVASSNLKMFDTTQVG